ncbi:Fe(2+)-dicitrate sensor, transmembrane component, partial [mine drainage metagenome]
MDRHLQAQFEADPVLRQAAEWFVELRGESISGERIAQWQQWLSEAVHRQAFERVESFWRMTAGVNARWPTGAELGRDEYAGNEGIAAWRARTRPDVAMNDKRCWLRHVPLMEGTWRWSLAGFFALAASTLAVAVITGLIYWPAISVFLQGGAPISVHTGIGEQRTLTLQDGTIISVGPDTVLTAVLRTHSRTIVLKTGEAYFHVKWDPARPFTVHVARNIVTDLGTTFDVRHVDGGIVVSIAEGVVRVTTPLPLKRSGAKSWPTSPNGRLLAFQLNAGQRLALEPFDATPRISSIDPKWVGGWLQGRLHYLDEPLGSVVVDLDRYSTRRIIVDDPRIARLRVTAVVSVHDIDAWVASLSAVVSGTSGAAGR